MLLLHIGLFDDQHLHGQIQWGLASAVLCSAISARCKQQLHL